MKWVINKVSGVKFWRKIPNFAGFREKVMFGFESPSLHNVIAASAGNRERAEI